MRVLSIGTDRKLFEKDSQVLTRSLGYAEKTEEFHTLVFTLSHEGHKTEKIGNLYIHPTNSMSKWFYVLDGLRLGKKIIKNSNISVISTQDPFQTGFVGMCLSKKFRLSLQIQIHTDFLSSHFSKSFLNKVRGLIASVVIPHAHGIRVVNEDIASSLRIRFKKLKVRVDVLPVFVDIEKIQNSTNSHKKPEVFSQFENVVFMASRLEKEKRIDVALASFKDVVKEFPGVGLVISGDGGERKKLEDYVEKLGLTPNVKFIGWNKDLNSYYKNSDIFLVTSEYEGYGMTFIEAGANSCPIITTKVGLAKTSLFKDGENSFVCEVGDMDCLAKSMKDLIKNPEKRKLFKDKMQDSIKATLLSKEEYGQKYVGLLESLISK